MIYAAIDIGTDIIKVILGKVVGDHVNILARTSTKTVGIKKGVIIDHDMVVKSLNLALEEITKQVGITIDKAIISIPSYDLKVDVYEGETTTFEGIVTGDDIINCFKNTIQANVSEDREVITVFPIDFLVDDEDKYYDPKGAEGYKLNGRVLISTLPKEFVYTYLDVMKDANVEVIDLCLSTVADFYSVNHEDFKRELGAVVNIGDSKTEISIFNKGLIIKGTVLDFGSRKIDHDIKYIYHLDKNTSKVLKETLALASSNYASSDETLEYQTLEGEEKVINQLEISQIVEARLEEILKSVKKSLNDLTNREISYIIISGGLSNIPGFSYILEQVFGDITYMMVMNTLGVRDNIYSTCYGMIKYYADKLSLRGITYTMYDGLKCDNNENTKKPEDLLENVLEQMQNFMDNN